MEENKFLVAFLSDLSRLSLHTLDNPELHHMTPSDGSSHKLTRVYSWFSAFISNDTDLMSDLIAHGLPIDVLHPLRHSTALMEAARLGRTDMVRWLLDQGADPCLLSGHPQGTPLHYALRCRRWKIATQLAESMADCSVMAAYGASPLHTLCTEATSGVETETMRHLANIFIAKGCPLNALDQEGATALHHCVINDLIELADTLLSHGANPNAIIPDTFVSPLTIAALEKNGEMAQTLMLYGADPLLKTKEGSTPLSIYPALAQLQVKKVHLSHAVH